MQKSIRDPHTTLNVLLEISRAVNNVSTLEKLYQSIHRSLGRILNVDNIYIAIYHEKKDSLTFQYFKDELDEGFGEIFNVKKKTSLTATVIKEQKPLIATEDDFLRFTSNNGEFIAPPCKVWIGAPLKIRGKAFGVLALQNYKSKDIYKESDLEILSTVSDFIAIAIDRKKAETAQKESEDLNYALFDISRAINISSSSNKLFDAIYASLGKIINVDNFYIALYDKKTNKITFPLHVDQYDDLSEWDVSYLKSDSLTHDVIQSKKAIFLKQAALQEKARDKKIVGTTPLIWLGVPLIFHDDPIGIMVVQSYTDPQAYNEFHIQILSAVSEQIATAIERFAYEEALERSQSINQVLYTVSNAVTTTDDLNELYKSIHLALKQVIDLTNFIIGLYNPDDQSILWGYYVDLFDDLQGQSTRLDNKGSIGRDIILSGEPVFLTEGEIKRRNTAQKAIGTWPKIWMGVPLKIEERVIGYMATQSYTDPHLFSRNDLKVFQAVSEQVATAIEKKRAEESRKKSKELNRAMFAIANTVNTTDNLDQLYRYIHQILGGIIDVTNFIIGIYDKKTDTITYPYYIDEKGDTYEEIKNVSSSGISAGEVIRLAKPFIATKAELLKKQDKTRKRLIGNLSEQWVGVPLKVKNEVIGVMVVQSYTNPKRYSQQDVEILVAVSDQIAIAIDRKREELARKKSDSLNKTLFEIANAANTTKNLRDLCQSIHYALKKITHVENFSIGIYDKDLDQLTFLYRSDEKDSYVLFDNISQRSSLTYETIRRGRTLLLTEDEQKEMVKALGGELIGHWAKSWLCIPLTINQEIKGALLTQDYVNEKSYKQADIELLELVSGQIASAIEKKQAEDSEKRSREINRVMFAISNAVNITENLDELYRSIHQSLGSIIDVTNFMIGIYDAKRDSISYPYFSDEREQDFGEIKNVSKSGIIASEVINRSAPFFIDKKGIIERIKKMQTELIGFVCEQWLGIPLKIKKKVIGVIVVQSYTNPELYTDDDVHILLAVSDQIAMAIERKQSEENIKLNEKLTSTLFRISNAVNTTDNLRELYHSIYESLNSLIQLPNFYITIVGDDGTTMHFPFYKDEYDGLDASEFEIPDFVKKPSITTDVIKNKHPMFLKKNDIEKLAVQGRILGTIPVVWLGIPLIIRDQVIGVIAAQHYSDPDYFSQRDMDLFIAVSDQIAMAIERKQSQGIIIEREKQIHRLSNQSQEFSLVAASIISMKDEKKIFKLISKAIVKHSDYNRLIISYFTQEPPFREIIRYEGIAAEEIERVKRKNAPKSYFENIFRASEKIGPLSYYLPHTRKEVMGHDIPIFLKETKTGPEDEWHSEDTIFIRMDDAEDNFIGVISVDDSKSGKLPTKETVRPLEIFSSLISQIMIFRKIQNELNDHKENLQQLVNERTQELTQEIAERIEIEKKLKKAKIEAEAAAEAKGEFLANMSHEIRTPINGIMGMAEIAIGRNLDQDLYRTIKTIDDEAKALLGIVNEVLDFSKIEAGRLELEKIPFNLRNTFETASHSLAAGIEKKGIDYITYLAPDAPVKVMGDPVRFRQILLNLIGNALKFTHHGEIFVKGEPIKKEQKRVKLKFIVKDTGIGIPEEHQEAIFSSFSQADGSTTRKYGGTGLGTTISKQLVELMGGRIGLKSKPGEGTTFWFTLSLDLQETKERKKEVPGINLKGLRIIVTVDHPTSRFVLIEYLRALEIEPIVAKDDREAIDILEREFDSGRKPDGILINLKSSNEKGFRLASIIRQNNRFSKLPIMMMTASGRPGDGQTCKDIGIDAYLLKPVKKDELELAICKSLYNISFSDSSLCKPLVTRHSIAEEKTNFIHILVAEDYPTNQQIALKHLEDEGYRVTLAENGKEAVDLFKKQQFDLILMDIQMPIMDGHKASRIIREYESRLIELSAGDIPPKSHPSGRTPIVAMTAHALVGYREKCLATGMDDYLSKPLRRDKFLAMVKKWTAPPQKNGKRSDVPVDVPEEDTSHLPNPPVDLPLNFEKALDEFGGDQEFLFEVIKEFIENVENQIPLVNKAIETGDTEIIKKESHAIKGGAANLTADSLSRTAHDLEKIGRSQDIQNAAAAFQKLIFEFARFRDFANALIGGQNPGKQVKLKNL